MSIRTRLLLLVFAVWLPAVLGFALLGWSTYLRETEATRERVRQFAQSVSLVTERELDKRVALAAIARAADTPVPDREAARLQAETFGSAGIQAIVAQYTFPEGSLASVVDAESRVMARSRDPEKFLGRFASPEMQKRFATGVEGFATSVTLDGVPSLTYVTRPNRHGWRVVIALPQAAINGSARRVALQASAAAGGLLLIGLALALYASRRIRQPVLALREAAVALGEDRVPPQLSTGVLEADVVSGALHRAGQRSHEATRTLEQRVAEAVQLAEQAQAKLLEGQKHEAIGRLTGGLAHDFNNLLQTIGMGLQVIDRTTPAEGPHRRVLQSSLRATSKAADLVRQMLAFGRSQPLRPQPLDFNDFVLKSQELMRKAVGERATLSAAIEPALPPLLVDATQLELAVLNLVFNARDALAGGGHIVLGARLATADEAGALPPGRYVRVQVADDGPGMDAATRERAFEPYFTTKPVGAGSGLGLAQVLAFARQSGGDAVLDSAPGEGTRVTLLLPATDAAPAASPAADAGTLPLRPLRILMVEDDVLVASVVVPALQRERHEVVLCNSADAAQTTLLAEGRPFDVLFSDIVMPGRLSGSDLLAWCRRHCPGLPVLLATGYSAQAVEPGVAVLRKPYDIQALLAALRAAVEKPGA